MPAPAARNFRKYVTLPAGTTPTEAEVAHDMIFAPEDVGCNVVSPDTGGEWAEAICNDGPKVKVRGTAGATVVVHGHAKQLESVKPALAAPTFPT